MTTSVDPIRRLPPPADVYAHIGHLLRELRIARRLLNLSKKAEEHTQQTPPVRTTVTAIPPQAQVANG